MDKKSTKVSDNYSIRKDRYQWVLVEHYLAEDKDGNPKEATRDSYHSTLEQVAKYLMNNKEQHSLERYINDASILWLNIKETLSAALEAE